MGLCRPRHRSPKFHRRQILPMQEHFVAGFEASGTMRRAAEEVIRTSATGLKTEVGLVIEFGRKNHAMRGTNVNRISADGMTIQGQSVKKENEKSTNTKESCLEFDRIQGIPRPPRSLLLPRFRQQFRQRIKSTVIVPHRMLIA